MILEKFRPEHLAEIAVQPAQQYLRGYLDQNSDAAVTAAAHPSYTGRVDGQVIVCAGIVPIWDQRALAWAWLGARARFHLVSVTRAVARFLDVQPYRRVEISVDRDFAEAHRWARMLGFKLEAGRMRAYRPDGGDCSLYARVRA
jgi:hypothetical protein